MAPKRCFHGGYELLYLACLNGFGKYATHNECSESRTETHLRRHYCHQAAQSERHDEQSLVVDELARKAQEEGHGKDAHYKPQHKEEAYLHDRTIISPPSGLEPLASADSITIITMASTSSSMSTLITGPANFCCRSPISVNAL